MQHDRAIPFSARLGLLATTLLLAVALVGGSWMNYRGAQAAGSSLNRSQADVVAVELRDAFHPWTRLPDSVALHGFMAANPLLAVRYIALLDRAGNVAVSAGDPALTPAPPPEGMVPGPGPPPMSVAGDRVRVYLPRPAAGLPAAEPAGDVAPAPRTAGPPRFVFSLVEFEPVEAAELVGRAQFSMGLSVVAAALLTLAALVFWRQSVRQEAERQQRAHQQRLSQLGEMSAVLAHEIRNPLASLKGNAQLLVERLAPETREHARAARVVHEATRLQALTSDLLDFARSGSIEPQQTSPTELLRMAAEEVGDDRVRIETDTAPARWTLDPSRIRQALVNLLRNAVQVSPDDRRPTARVAQMDGRLVFDVRDFGPGLPDTERERIFEPFFTTRTHGTGLGLSIARRAVELHGGSLTAHNHPEGGAVFRLMLPDAREKATNGSHPDR
jgi:two-component system, NtrC family, sensor histidine kinase HydH